MKHAAREKNAATCALYDSDLDRVSGGSSLSEMKAESNAKADNAMAAATSQLVMGIAASTAAITSAASVFTPSGKHR